MRVAKLGRILRFVMALRTLIQSIIYTLSPGRQRIMRRAGMRMRMRGAEVHALSVLLTVKVNETR